MGANRRYSRDLDAPSYRPRHVWVRTSDRSPIWPGILVEWRRTENGWQARVAYAAREGNVGDGWFTPEQVRPAQSGNG